MVLEVRRRTMGYVSQFLRVIPRVPPLDMVAEPLRRHRRRRSRRRVRGPPNCCTPAHPRAALGPGAGDLLRRRAAAGQYRPRLRRRHPILLLDEPTASLDAGNRAVVIELIAEAKAEGRALVGIFHDDEVREAVSSRIHSHGPLSDDHRPDPDQRPHRHRDRGVPRHRRNPRRPDRQAGPRHCRPRRRPRRCRRLPGRPPAAGAGGTAHRQPGKAHHPAPQVRWNAAAAVMAHDAQMAAAGITTVFDAISCGDVIEGSERLANLQAMVDGVTAAQSSGYLRAEHRLHLRCEVSSANIVSIFDNFAGHPLVGIVSLMDHTPGQRQFVHHDKYMDYYMGKYHFTAAEMAEFARLQIDNSARYSARHRTEIAAACHARGLTLASHDDATPDHVDEALTLGIHFSEFPTTVEAARAAHGAGIRVLMGAPNLVRGGSHSGNVAAGELAKAGILDVLSSDYVPVSLMHAAFLLSRDGIGLTLPAAIATVSAVPAAVAGLGDRGAIAVGRRADLVRVHDDGACQWSAPSGAAASGSPDGWAKLDADRKMSSFEIEALQHGSVSGAKPRARRCSIFGRLQMHDRCASFETAPTGPPQDEEYYFVSRRCPHPEEARQRRLEGRGGRVCGLSPGSATIPARGFAPLTRQPSCVDDPCVAREKSRLARSVRVLSCVRPVGAARMAAGPDEIR